MRFDNPLFLLLLPCGVWFWRLARVHAPGRAPWLRVACVSSIVLGLSGLHIGRGETPMSIVFAIDRSHSATPALQKATADLVRANAGMRTGDRAALVVFGTEAAVERGLTPSLDTQAMSAVVGGGGTNIASALRVARALLPAGESARIVLLSDGQQTAGDAIDEAARAGSRSTPIDVIVPAPSAVPPLDVVRIGTPATAQLGDAFNVVVTAAGAPGAAGTIELRRGSVVQRQEITLPPEGLTSIVFPDRPERAGTHVFEARVEFAEAADFRDDAVRAGAVVTVVDRPNVLYVGGDPATLRNALLAAQFRLQAIEARLLPGTAAALAAYDAIVLDDVDVEQLDGTQRDALTGFVEQHGGGLLLLGSPETLDAGQLAGHALGDLLPVDFRPRSGERAPSLALVIAFDKSGSMDDRVEGVPRIEFARQAARRVVEAVPASDAVGIIAFDSTAHAVAPLGTGRDARTMTSALAAVRPSGATVIAPAIELASTWLREAAANGIDRRHVLLVSDGRTSPADAARLETLVRGAGFELSAVALGADADRRFLAELARLGGGRAYFPSDIRDVPRIAARESARVAGGRIVDEPFQPRALPHPLLAGIDSSRLPALGGYVVGVTRPSAEAALQSALGDPVLATRRAGLGRVAVYTADIHSAWSAGLRGWDGFAQLMAQTTRWVARRVRDESLYAHFAEDDDGLRVVVEAHTAGGQSLNDLLCMVVVRSPAGTTETLSLAPTAPGRYETRVASLEPGAYVFSISGISKDGRVDSRIVRGFYWTAAREYRNPGVNRALLERIAEASGGRVLSGADDVFAAPRESRYADARPWLAGAALFLFLADVFTSRGRDGNVRHRRAARSDTRNAA